MAIPAVYGFRNIFGGAVPVMKMVAGADLSAAAYGTPVVVDAGSGKVSACDDSAVVAFGWLVSTGAADATVDVVPAYPGIQALMAETGTYGLAKLFDYLRLTKDGVTSIYTVNWDTALTSTLLKPMERIVDVDGKARVYVEIPPTLSQAVAEVS